MLRHFLRGSQLPAGARAGPVEGHQRELLALSLSAGERGVGALERVARTSGGELSAELRRTLADARAGASLVQALEGLASRTSLVSLARFVDGVAVAWRAGQRASRRQRPIERSDVTLLTLVRSGAGHVALLSKGSLTVDNPNVCPQEHLKGAHHRRQDSVMWLWKTSYAGSRGARPVDVPLVTFRFDLRKHTVATRCIGDCACWELSGPGATVSLDTGRPRAGADSRPRAS